MPTAEAAIAWEQKPTGITEWAKLDEHESDNLTYTIQAEDLGEDGIIEELETRIEEARRILELDDDWDGEGSPAYSQDTLDRAVEFLTKQVDWLWKSFSIRLPIPRISPGPDGSIDLHWKQPSWELLINIPADASEMASFYGDNYATQKIGGRLDTSAYNLGIAAWLMN